MHWTQVVERWRRLPAETKLRLRWEAIPADVAQSMAFEGEPVNFETLQLLHARLTSPAGLKPHEASSRAATSRTVGI
jgi:hypothetical protein